MKYKNTVLWLVLLLGASVAACQEIAENHYEFKVEVTDDFGKPVADASVTASKDVLQTVRPVPSSKSVWVANSTDAKGIASFEFKSVHSPGGILVKKDGYYDSTASASWQHLDGKSGFRTEISTILKPVKKPIPMHAVRNLRIRTPEFDVPYGFDLEAGESLPPFGKGRTADIEFILRGERLDSADPENEEIDFRMEIRCTNEGDGFVEFEIDDAREFSKGSALQSSHEAPDSGYVPALFRTAATGSGGTAGKIINHKNSEAAKCCYFRVRTKKDGNGNIISSHFGKLYGPLEIRPAFKRYGHDVSKGQGGFYIQYLYFNPTPNDRNVEFDPKRNLHPEGDVRRP